MVNKIVNRIKKLANEKERVLIAIDGRCASGKTTLSETLKNELSYKGIESTVIHIDEFFLRPEQRSKERLETPGENIDHERFLEKVLIPIKEQREVKYRPFDCSVFALGEEKTVEINKTVIIEGSYSHHQNLKDFYDLKIFLTSKYETRLERILKRNGEKMLQTFIDRWIPLEEKYFEAFKVDKNSDFIIET